MLDKNNLCNLWNPCDFEYFWRNICGFKENSYLCRQKNKEMKKISVLRRLQILKGQLGKVGVTQLGLFGSTVRGENTPQSDIDILIDFEAGQETYQNFITACQILEENFRRYKLDVVTKKGLSPYIGKTILNEIEYV